MTYILLYIQIVYPFIRKKSSIEGKESKKYIFTA